MRRDRRGPTEERSDRGCAKRSRISARGRRAELSRGGPVRRRPRELHGGNPGSARVRPGARAECAVRQSRWTQPRHRISGARPTEARERQSVVGKSGEVGQPHHGRSHTAVSSRAAGGHRGTWPRSAATDCRSRCRAADDLSPLARAPLGGAAGSATSLRNARRAGFDRLADPRVFRSARPLARLARDSTRAILARFRTTPGRAALCQCVRHVGPSRALPGARAATHAGRRRRRYPPATAPTTRNGSFPSATASGTAASGDSCDRSCSHA